MDTADLPRHQRPTKLGRFLFGVPYYPEHFSAADREHDAERMAAAGVNVVRMGEFAWDRMEPRRGAFDWSLFDETLARLGAADIDTILCTPTATPPRWLTHGHDDWLRVDADGRRMEHGSRQHCCTNNPRFRAESRRITRAMAEHFAGVQHVIGWQTDNEIYCHFSKCYCPACVSAFRHWLRGRYGGIEALNAAWGAAFWAQSYGEFEQIPLPDHHGRPTHANPTHERDYDLFLSDAAADFQREQVQILRAADRRWWVTHNGMFGPIDYWRFTEDLDFLGVDVYPSFGGSAPADALWGAFKNEQCRAVSGGYIVPEQQGGPGAQKPFMHPTPRPGQMRLWAWQSIAHGADGVLHFRWRTCRFGAEMYWCGILDHDNVPRRRYEEFRREGAELKRLGPRIAGTVLDVRAAVLLEQEQIEAQGAIHMGLPYTHHQAQIAYGELWRRHLPCGCVNTADSFAGLKLLVLPSMPLMDEPLAAKLRGFVAGGGVLLATARTATRDRNNHVTAATPPGLLADLFGVTVEEFGRIEPGAMSFSLPGGVRPAGEGYEILRLRGARASAAWAAVDDDAPHAAVGAPAIAINGAGKGAAVYAGTFLTPDNVGTIMEIALALTDIAPLAACDDHVEVTCRHGGAGAGRRLVFVLNHYPQPKGVRGLPEGTELLTGTACTGALELAPWEVAVVEPA